MRRILPLLLLVLAICLWVARFAAYGQVVPGATSGQQTAEAQFAAADIRVMTPGVVNSSGLPDLAAAFTKQTGKKVAILVVGMGTIVQDMKTHAPAPDVIVLPLDLMATLSLDGGVVPGSFIPLGRTPMGLAVRAGAPHPDISTVDQLAAAMRGKTVMHSNPATRTMVALMIDGILKRPEFSGATSMPAPPGLEGGQALAQGHGDMAIQTVSQILPYKEIELVGPLPRELGAWIDLGLAVSSRARDRQGARAFIDYLLRPESNSVWKPRGLERYE